MPEFQTQGVLFRLLGRVDPPELGSGPRPGVWPQARVEALLEQALSGRSFPQETRGAVEALVLLWHDHWDAAHRRVQPFESPDASLVHAIVHRREPDYWNSKYWWQRAGAHPCFPELARRVSAFLEGEADAALARQLIRAGQWDALAMVEACAAAAAGPPGDPRVWRLRQIQRLETETALAHWLGAGAR